MYLSIIIPVINKKFLKKSLNSILKQNIYKKFEILLIYNGPKKKISFEYKKLNYKIFFSSSYFNAAHARNIGVKHAKGRYISFLDCGDVWCLEFINSFIEVTKRKEKLFHYGSYLNVKKNVNILRKAKLQKNLLDLITFNTIGTSSVIIHKKIAQDFDEQLLLRHDIDLWYRIIKKLKKKDIYINNKIVYFRHFNKNSLSASFFNKSFYQIKFFKKHYKNTYLLLFFILILRHLINKLKECTHTLQKKIF